MAIVKIGLEYDHFALTSDLQNKRLEVLYQPKLHADINPTLETRLKLDLVSSLKWYGRFFETI
jgi:hypothetical protein